jgi:hypothetical protein
MAVLIAPEIGVFQAVLKKVEPTKNPDYVFVVWQIRNRSNILIDRKDVISAEEAAFLLKLEPGKNYNFECEVSLQQAKDKYPARLQYKPIKVV